MAVQAPVVPRRASAGEPPPGRSTRRVRAGHSLAAYLLIAPAFVIFTVVMLVPIGKAAQVSLYEWSPFPGVEQTFLGAGNYTRALSDPLFGKALLNATVYMLVTVPAQILLGLVVALLLESRLPGRTLLRVLYYLPVVTSWVVVSLLFRYLFATDGGLVNWVLVDGVHVAGQPVGWLDSRWTGILAMCALGIWKGIGWTAIILLAGLTNVPRELHESAATDGAGYLRRVWHVTLPALRGQLLFVTVLLVIGGFQVFIQVLLMTNGGPAGDTEMPLTYLYKQAFSYLDFGYGSALAVIMTVLVLVLSVGQTVIANRRAAR
ncbi:sugar ABC transporter permease [Luedemannella helvata]|uniref:Sugar ABC transporter permease n=1 Tax=Luedemannella helvata TaxID=349315 RepID=A0ABP4W029_9ACTN